MIIVGKESYCDYQTIQAALDSLPYDASGRRILIMSGIYHEKIVLKKKNLKIIGLGTVEVRYSDGAFDLMEDQTYRETFRTPTCFIQGENLYFENIIFSNAAGQGEDAGQAIACYVHGDKISFNQCVFKGYQDTLFIGPLPICQKNGTPFPLEHELLAFAQYRSYYLNCQIEGTVDYIFGGGLAYFETCLLLNLKRKKAGTPAFITAASTSKGQRYGFVFDYCLIKNEDEKDQTVYLGRPWRKYAKTLFNHCFLGSSIVEEGWDYWEDISNQKTVNYVENNSIITCESVNRPEWIEFNEYEIELSREEVLGVSFFRE